MKRLRSLRIRIAATVFLLELVMLTLVLWQTQSEAYERAQHQIDTQDDTIIQLLGEVSHTALLTTEFSEVSPLFEETTSNPHIIEVRLYDRRDRVIAGSSLNTLGLGPETETSSKTTYWRHHQIEGSASILGELHVLFSNKELETAYHETLTLGISIAASGMIIIALAGLALGHVLTLRLQRVIEQTRRFALGELDVRTQVGGNDEITELANAFNHMASQISSSFEHIEQLAYRDALTGLANRIEFDQRLERAVKSSGSGHHEHALLYLDLDQFKIVNDTCGHDAGDRLLVELAQVLAGSLRNRDTIARLGGDEFGVLLENCLLDEAQMVAEKIREAVADFRFTWNSRSFRIGVSIGLVQIRADSGDSKKLLSLADMACYAAKDMGRNAIRVAGVSDDEINLRAREMQWVSRIQEAMEQHRFEVHSQAITGVDNLAERPFKEYLLRLRQADDTLVSPGTFLPAAERFGLMQVLDRHAISLVLEHLAEQPQSLRPQLAFINLSGASIGDRSIARHIAAELSRLQLPAASVCFEITETVAVNNHLQAVEFIEQIRSLGCRFALDDFGSGMCSFTYLKSMRVDFVKIDGGFIRNILDSSIDCSIVTAINAIAHDANFATIAEGVESEDVLQRLKELGIDYAQGYFIEHPHADL